MRLRARWRPGPNTSFKGTSRSTQYPNGGCWRLIARKAAVFQSAAPEACGESSSSQPSKDDGVLPRRASSSIDLAPLNWDEGYGLIIPVLPTTGSGERLLK